MANHRNRFPARRRFLKQSTALTATVVALPLPRLADAQPQEVQTRDKTERSQRPAPGTEHAPTLRRRRVQKTVSVR